MAGVRPGNLEGDPERWRLGDRAVSSVIGTLLMALLTVTMALTLSDFVSDSLPEASPKATWDLSASLEPGVSQWGDGDELITIIHRGGSPLHTDQTRVRIDVDGTVTTDEGAGLGGAFTDGSLTIGEHWNRSRTVPAKATVHVQVIVTGEPSRVVADATLRSGRQDCTEDTTAPTVAAFSQAPSDLDSADTGPLAVTATVEDGCAGVDTNVTPHLIYQVGNGTTLLDAGAMTHVSSTSWQGEIPEPQDGWAAHENQTVSYHLDPIEDRAGNQRVSDDRSDRIQPGTPAPGTLTYATEHVNLSGTLANMSHLQNASDGGLVANLTENATGGGPVTSEIYGTAHSSSGADGPGNTTGAPDDAHGTLPNDKDWVGVTGFNTFQGTISTVELGFEAHADGTTNGAEDALELSYEIAGTAGPTTETYNVTELGTGSDGGATYLNVTGDRAWSWSDVSNLLVKATYAKQQVEDAVDLDVDALWTRVTYEDQGWNASVGLNVTQIPTGDQHEVELNYATTGETFHLDILNTTAGNWVEQGTTLSQTTRTNVTVALEDAEIDNGTVRLRLRDAGTDATAQDTLELDHVRVRTR